jgi:hypothetical protein
MGGREAWDNTRYIRWTFFDRRTHYWDEWTDNHRIENDGQVILFNVNTREGRAWDSGDEVTDGAARTVRELATVREHHARHQAWP